MTAPNPTPCSFPACDTGPGEPCDRHEREWSHAEDNHELCGSECHATITPLPPEREAEIRERAAAEKPGHVAIRDLLAELDRVRAWHENYKSGTRTAGVELRKRLTAAEAERDELKKRVTELERAAVEGRAALADLVQDHEDPGTAALGALYMLSQATTGIASQPDDAASALARHDAATLDSAADELMNHADRLAGQYADSGITGDGPAAVLEAWGRAEETVRSLAARVVKGSVR